MKRVLLACVLAFGTAQAAVQKVTGFDVRSKSDKYELEIGRENAILEERQINLYKVDGSQRTKVKSLDVVYISEDLSKDIDAVYTNDEAVLQFGRMRADARSKKTGRVVVLKLDPKSEKRKTLVFEASAALE